CSSSCLPLIWSKSFCVSSSRLGCLPVHTTLPVIVPLYSPATGFRATPAPPAPRLLRGRTKSSSSGLGPQPSTRKLSASTGTRPRNHHDRERMTASVLECGDSSPPFLLREEEKKAVMNHRTPEGSVLGLGHLDLLEVEGLAAGDGDRHAVL